MRTGYPAGTCYRNDVVQTSMRCNDVASTLVRRLLGIMFERYNKSLKRYKIEGKLNQEKQKRN